MAIYSAALSNVPSRLIATQASQLNSPQAGKEFLSSNKSVLVAQLAVPAPTTLPMTGAEGGISDPFYKPKSTINYAPKFIPNTDKCSLNYNELHAEIKAQNFRAGFIDTLQKWLPSEAGVAAPKDLQDLVISHIKKAKHNDVATQDSVKGKRAKNRERGNEREAKVATGAPLPPKKPKKNKDKLKTNNTKLDNVQKPSQPDQTPRPMGDWRLDSKGVKVYVGPKMTAAPQRPTTMPNSSRLNNPEPPTKWERVDGVKKPLEPHTAQQPSVKPRSEHQYSVEREFWKTVEFVKTLVP